MFSRFFVLVLAAFLTFSPGAFASLLGCAGEFALEDHAIKLVNMFQALEHPVSPLLFLPGGRIANGTSIGKIGSAKMSGTVTGGRFLVHDFSTDTPVIELELPTHDGTPTMVKELSLSPNRKFMATTGGDYFGGPAYFYETDPPRFRYTKAEFRRPFDLDVEAAMRPFRIKGVPYLERARREIDPKGEITRLYKTDPEVIRNGFTGPLAAGRPNEPEMIPVKSVEFHPSGDSFMLDNGIFLSFHDVHTGRELSRFAPIDRYATHVMDPPTSYYLGKGNYVAQVSRMLTSLWRASDGRFMGQVLHDGEIDALSNGASFKNAANGEFISYCLHQKAEGHANGVNSRLLVAAKKVDGKTRLVTEKTYSVPAKAMDRTPGRFPSTGDFPNLAFSNSGYVVVMPDGKSTIYSQADHSPQFDFQFGDKMDFTDLRILDVTFSNDGKWIGISGQNKEMSFLEIWSPTFQRGVRLRLPHPEGRVIIPRELTFSPDSAWLAFFGWDWKHTPEDQPADIIVNPYIIDVYKVMSSLGPAPKP